jgi:PAS domain S-box-containing protein
MLTVYNCLVTEHDLRLVALAAVICALASFAAISLLHHMRRSQGRMRLVWLAVSATATGFGIWATHFIAMLAFAPGLPNAYDVALTFLSLVIAVTETGVGLAIAARSDRANYAALGGAIVGGGIVAMHFTGMAAFEVEGQIIWDPELVLASIVLGALIAALALPIGLRSDALRWKVVGALTLTLAICAMHFTAMGAVSIMPDGDIVLSQSSLPANWLAGSAAFASFVIIGLALAGAAFDVVYRQRERQTEQLLGLANAAVEGLVVCEEDVIVAVNESFSRLVGLPCSALAGSPLDRCFPDEVTHLKLLERPDQPVEGEVVHCDGTRVPVELIQRRVDFVGKAHRAIAVRDLRARKEAEQHIRFLAHHDALTGLPNRDAFNKKLDQEIETALSTGRGGALPRSGPLQGCKRPFRAPGRRRLASGRCATRSRRPR